MQAGKSSGLLKIVEADATTSYIVVRHSFSSLTVIALAQNKSNGFYTFHVAADTHDDT